MTLRLTDVRHGVRELSLVPRRPMAVVVAVDADRAITLRRLVHADVLRRVAERHGAVVDVSVDGEIDPDTATAAIGLNCRPPRRSDARPDVVVGDAGPADAVVSAPPVGPSQWCDGGLDVRLAMLDGTGDLTRATEELQRWRQAVAQWAEHPSKPMCADYVAWCHEAADADLDTPRLLTLMREVESHRELPPGSKFETFAHLDTLVGLDLAAEVGLGR